MNKREHLLPTDIIRCPAVRVGLGFAAIFATAGLGIGIAQACGYDTTMEAAEAPAGLWMIPPVVNALSAIGQTPGGLPATAAVEFASIALLAANRRDEQ